jgi:hypothetical protein
MKSLSARGLALSLIFSTAHARAEDRNWICQKPDLPVIAQTPPARSAEPFPIILGRPLPGSHESGSQPSILDPRITRVSFQIDPSETNEIWKPAKKPLVEAAGSASPSAGDAARPPENPRDMLPDPFAVTPQPRASPAEPAAPLNGARSWNSWCDSVSNPREPFAGESPGSKICGFYASAEYLLWWTKDPRFPPLVTTSPPSSGGILGNPGTTILVGGGHVDQEERSGGRFTIGYSFDGCKPWALEGSFFFLGERSIRSQANSADFPVLARPFFDLNFGREFSEISAGPGLAMGRIDVTSPSRFWGAEANVRCLACCGCSYRLEWLAGFRFLELEESLEIRESLQSSPQAPQFPNSQILVVDRFATRNQFYGGQVGVVGVRQRGPWFFECCGKVALGATHEVINIDGNQVIVDPTGTVSTFRGGLLALSSNIGHFSRDRFAVVPEVGINLGYQLTENLHAFVGYTFLYWNRVVRPADQIDRGLDITRIPNFGIQANPLPTPRPAVLFRETEFWAQGINFGLEFRY